MAFELVSLESVLIILIGLVIGLMLEFGIFWLTLRDKFLFLLKQKFLGKGGKIHLQFWHRDGTVTDDLQNSYKINEEGIFWSGDKEKKFKVHYVPSNQRDSLGQPIANVVEGLNYTPDLRERNEKIPVNKTNDKGEIVVDENGQPVLVEQWHQLIGAGFTTKKASELAYSNNVSAVAFGRATALKEAEQVGKEAQYTLGLLVIILFVTIIVGVLVFMHDGKLDQFITFVSGYKGVADAAIANAASSISAS